MKTKFIKGTRIIDESGSAGSGVHEILIRVDMIAAVTQYCLREKFYGDMKQYWTTKIIMTSGKEINLSQDYDTLVKEWTEAVLYE